MRRTPRVVVGAALIAAAMSFALTGFAANGAGSLAFNGNQWIVQTTVHDATSQLPANVGATAFTIEWWMKASSDLNSESAVPCGANDDWILGNILIDRDRGDQGQAFGASIAGGSIVFGVTGASAKQTICGTQSVLDDKWHHVAIEFEKSDGAMWIFVDGSLDAQGTGPAEDISYPANGTPDDSCNGLPCTTDVYMGIGGAKRSSDPSFRGSMSEIRISNSIRYRSAFAPPKSAFATDAHTVALYHLNEGSGTVVHDSSGVTGSKDATRVAGDYGDPQWSSDNPFVRAAPIPSSSSSHDQTQSQAQQQQGTQAISSNGSPSNRAPSIAPSANASNELALSEASPTPKSTHLRGLLGLDPGIPPIFIALIGLGIAIAVASKLLREDRM
ncbi:MAG: LamG-like jellyroll fold domain-containing protein [Actinomycetota bacterium]